jgi:hypothetical protein
MNVRLGSATTIPLADCGEILAVADVAAADSRSPSAVASEVTDQERRLPLAVSGALTSFRRFPRAREGRGGSGPSFGSSRRRFLFAKFFLTGSVGRAAPARRLWLRRPS